jgi:hypothetical protein
MWDSPTAFIFAHKCALNALMLGRLFLEMPFLFKDPNPHKEVVTMLYEGCSGRSRPASLRLARLRSVARVRCKHDSSCLIQLISPSVASERWGLTVFALQEGARNGVLPHYIIGEGIRFDPIQLDRWARDRGLTEFNPHVGEWS